MGLTLAVVTAIQFYLLVVGHCRNPCEYFAERLYKVSCHSLAEAYRSRDVVLGIHAFVFRFWFTDFRYLLLVVVVADDVAVGDERHGDQ